MRTEKEIEVETCMTLVRKIEEVYCKPCMEDGQDYNGVCCRACKFDDCIVLIEDYAEREE